MLLMYRLEEEHHPHSQQGLGDGTLVHMFPSVVGICLWSGHGSKHQATPPPKCCITSGDGSILSASFCSTQPRTDWDHKSAPAFVTHRPFFSLEAPIVSQIMVILRKKTNNLDKPAWLKMDHLAFSRTALWSVRFGEIGISFRKHITDVGWSTKGSGIRWRQNVYNIY